MLILVAASPGCDCGGAANASSDAAIGDAMRDAASDRGGATRDGEAGMLDGEVPDSGMCGTTSCCDPSELPPLSPSTALIVVPNGRPIVFEPALPSGVTIMNVTWVGSSETDGVTDMEFAGEAGAFHARLAVLALPPLVPGQSLTVEVERLDVPDAVQTVYDERLAIRDAETGVLLAGFVSQGAAPETFRRRPEIRMEPFLISAVRVCQGPVAHACSYQTELFDLWFSIDSSEAVVAGQSEVRTLVEAGRTYRVFNRHTLDDGGDEASKSSCGFIAGAREFDIVLAP
jgi:hypothetical protein